MLRKSLLTAIGVATFIVGGTALAADTAHPANNEAGSVYHGAEYAKVDGKFVRVDSWNMRTGAVIAPIADDGWERIDGEAGWQLRPHRYDFVNGRLVHTDTLPHDTARPKVTADAETFYRDGHSTRPR